MRKDRVRYDKGEHNAWRTYSGERVERDSLEADEVGAGGHGLRDRRGPRAVLRDHLAVAPGALRDRAGDQTDFVDLELHSRNARIVNEQAPPCGIAEEARRTHLSEAALTPVQVVPPHCAR